MQTNKNTESKSGKLLPPKSSTSTQTTEPHQTGECTYFPGGIYIAKGLIPSELHKKALQKLTEGLTKTVRLEKIHHKGNVYSIRASKGARIMGVCAPCAHLNNQAGFFVFAFYDKHQYSDLKFLTLTHLEHPVVDLDFESEHTSLIKNAINQVPRSAKKNDLWNEAHYINNQVICFSDQQEKVIHTTTLPVIVTGAAGSGKTLIIIKILHDLLLNSFCNDKKKNYIYIAPTERLAKEAARIFNELIQQVNPNQPVNADISFVSIEHFILSHKPDHQKIEYRENLLQWLKTQTATAINNAQLKKLLTNPDYLIEEFKTTAIMPKEDYVQLGAHQSLLGTHEEKKLCYELYALYKKKHPNSCQILFPELRKTKPQFDLVIIDEGQTFSIKQLKVLSECARNGQFMIFGDPLQNFSNKISVFPQLKQIIRREYHQLNPIISLQTAYRNPLPVIHFANDIIYTRRMLAGGIDDDCESLQLIPADLNATGQEQVEWISNLNKAKIEQLTVLLKQANAMLITNDENHLNQAWDLFDKPLILYPEYIQGLEATTVVVYCPFNAELIKKINTQLKKIDPNKNPIHKPTSNTTGTPEFTSDMNRLFTAVTRVAQTKGKLFIYMGEHEKHHSELFFNQLKRSIPQQSATSELDTKPNHPITTSLKEWEEWIKNIYRSGNEEKAWALYLTHVSEDRSGFNKLVEDKRHIITKQLALPAEQSLQQKENNHTKKPELKTMIQPNTNSSNIGSIKTTLSGGVFSTSDHYIHQLLENCSVEKLGKFFQNKKANDYLFYKYKQKGCEQKETFLETLIFNPQYLKLLNELIHIDPFATRAFTSRKEAILNIVITALMNNPLNCQPILKFVYQLLEQHPFFIDYISLEHLKVLALADLDKSYQSANKVSYSLSILHKILEVKSELLIEDIQRNSQDVTGSMNPDFWFIQLLQSHAGCYIINTLAAMTPDLFTYINPLMLIKEMTRLNSNGSSLFFWLNTTLAGQELFKDILLLYPQIRYSLTTTVLSSTLNDITHRFHGTNLIFWLIKGESNFQILSLIGQNNENLADLQKLIKKEKHNPIGEICAYPISPSFLPFYCPKMFVLTTIEKEVLFKLARPHTSRESLSSALKSILDHPNAESILFDYPLARENNLFETLLENKDYYEIFLNLLNTHAHYCKLIPIERLMQFYVNEKWSTTVLTASIIAAPDNSLLLILIKHNPKLIQLIHQHNLLHSFNGVLDIETQQTMSLFYLLCEGLEIYAPHLQQLIQKSHLTPQLFDYLLGFVIEPQSNRMTTNFHSFVFNKNNLLNSWIKLEPRMINYFRIEHFLAQESTRSISPFHYLILNDTRFDFLFDVLMARPDLREEIDLTFLTTTTNKNCTPLYYLSVDNKSCELLYNLVLSNKKNNNILISPRNLQEIDTMVGETNTITNLLNFSFGIDFIIHLMSNPLFAKTLSIDLLMPLNPISLTNVTVLLGSDHGAKILLLLLKAQPDCLKKLTKSLFFDELVPNHRASMFTLLRNRIDFFDIIGLILKNNPALIDAAPLSSSLMTTIDRLEKAYAIQFDYKWYKQNQQLSNSIKKPQSQLSLDSQSTLQNPEKTLASFPGEEIKITLQPDEAVVVTNYINNLLKMFNPVNIRNMLLHKKADTYLLTPIASPNDKSETLFEIILDNPQYLQLFNYVLQNNKFLATGRVIFDSKPINDVITRIITPDKVDINHIKLFDILITRQPGLTLSIATEFITPTLFYRLSCNELARHAFDKMISNYPDFFQKIIEKMASTNNENQEDWIGELLKSKSGCAIISTLYNLNDKLLNCVTVNKLAKRASQNNEISQAPLYFWLSATKDGQVLLYHLLNKYPPLVSEITEPSLTQTVIDNDPLYNGTNTLFWINGGFKYSQLIVNLIHSSGKISKDIFNTTLRHPLYLQSIINPEIPLEDTNYTNNILISSCFLPVNYNNHHYGAHGIWGKEETDLINAVLSLTNTKNKTHYSNALKKLLNHPNAESLLFDSYNAYNDILFTAITLAPFTQAIFCQFLKENSAYYTLFSIKRLNQYIKWTDSALVAFLAEQALNLLTLLVQQKSISKHFDTEFLLKPINITNDHHQQDNLLSLLCSDPQRSSILNYLDLNLILTPELGAELFRIRTATNNQNESLQFFSFSHLYNLNTKLITHWVNTEPRLLNYMTADHLVANTHIKSNPTPVFCYLLSYKVEGIQILDLVLKKDPAILRKLLSEDLIANSSNQNSLLYHLSMGSNGCKIIEQMVLCTPELFKNIRPIHLMEKICKLPSSVKNKLYLSTLLENLFNHDNELVILNHFMAQPDFIKEFDPSILFKPTNKYFYQLCTQNGKPILQAILTEYPQIAKLITKDIFYKCTPSLSNKSPFLSILPGIEHLSPEHMLCLTKIIRENPGLIDLPNNEIEPLDCLHKLLNIQLNYKGSGLSKPQRSFIQLMLSAIFPEPQHENKSQFSLS